jgi:hypothetical protein
VISWRFFSVYKNHVVFSIPRNSWLGGYNIEFNSLKFGWFSTQRDQTRSSV